ncbi:MAG: DNA repair protein RecN [Desulfovibrionales bacterium]|nr:MAG: DNA repair protein RecN [Desulfovibrionales bacterium]
MLELLRIRNLALIEDLELEFGTGLNVITGETGAGKSFILRALDFLLGEKLAVNLVRPGHEKARVEAVFMMGENGSSTEMVIRRELSAQSGRSRVWVNDELASQESLKRLRPRLILHASQHSQQQLRLPSFHARLLDRFLGQPELVHEKERYLNALTTLVERRRELEERLRDLRDRKDLLEYQRGEIAKIDPKSGEEEELEARKQTLRDQTQAQQHVDEAIGLLCTPETGLHDALGRLRKVVLSLESLVAPRASETAPKPISDSETLLQFEEHLHDLEQKLRGVARIQTAQGELDSIEARLWELSQLKRKLKRPLDEIVRLKEEVDANLSYLDASGLDLKQLEREIHQAKNSLREVLDRLDRERRQTAKDVGQRLSLDLRELGFSEYLKLEFTFVSLEIFPGLTEYRPRLLWAPNPGQPFQPLEDIASGGELSRVLLAIIGLMADADNPTLIFDEVDAGIGGMTLHKVGDRLRSLAAVQQVLVITHWPQLAAQGDTHFQVRKEVLNGATYTRCTALEAAEREDELRRMAGGGWRVEEDTAR